jgi:hypothetical protein
MKQSMNEESRLRKVVGGNEVADATNRGKNQHAISA